METEYKKIYQFENLYQAYRKTARGKRGRNEVVQFEMNLAENLWRLHDQLKKETYVPAPYYCFTIHDPKVRKIEALDFADRVVQHSLCDYILMSYFENRLIYDSAACRKGKGTHFAMDRLSEFLREFYRKNGTKGYILKCDVKKYFENIDHDRLKYILRKFPDDKVRNMLYHIIDGYHPDTGKGVPLGNQSSQWFALYYLDRLDRIVKEKYRIRYYTRYMDDLGWRFYLTDSGKVIRRLRTSNKKRFKRRLRAFAEAYRNDEKSFEEIKRSLASYNGHLSHGHTWKLKQRVYRSFVLTKAPKLKEKQKIYTVQAEYVPVCEMVLS